MTEAEFREEVCDIGSLVDFCNENYRYSDYASEIMYEDNLEDYIEDEVRYLRRDCGYSWMDVADWIRGIPRCEWYDTSDGLNDASDYFDDICGELLEKLTLDGFFDEEDDDCCDDGSECQCEGIYKYVSNDTCEDDEPFMEPGVPMQFSDLVNAACIAMKEVIIM